MNQASPNHAAQFPARVMCDEAEALAVARDLARRFASGAAARDAARILPQAEVATFSHSGLWSLNVPRDHGGPGLGYGTVARMFVIIAAADASIAQIAQNHVSLIDLIRFDPHPEKRRTFYDAALRGQRFGNAISERGGAHVRDVQTTATPVRGGWRLTGEKFYCTGALFAHFVPVLGLAPDGKGRLAFVARDTAGLEVLDDWSGMGQRTTASGTVRLTDVFVPDSHVIDTRAAWDAPSVHGPVAQIIQAAIDIGLARGAIDQTIAFVRTRARPWVDSGVDRAADDPFVIRDIAALKIKLHTAEALLDQAGAAIDAGLLDENAQTVATASLAVARAKIAGTEIALLAGSKLFELGGTRAVLEADNLSRFWRDARTHTLHDPVRWKYHALGDFALNGTLPPRHSWN